MLPYQKTLRKIAVVGEGKGLREILQKELDDTDFSIYLIDGAKDALKSIAKNSFDLVIVDFDLPEMDGMSFVHLLKVAQNTKNIPVVMISPDMDADMEKEGASIGVVDFMRTPIEYGAVLKTLEKIFEIGIAPNPAANSKILIVDDSPIMCRVYTQIMTNHGFSFRVLQDSTKAVDAALQFAPDLILLDANMPKIDGYELTRLIRNIKGMESVSIIMVTSDTKKTSAIKALTNGVTDFLTKPFDEEVLLARMRVHLNNKKLFDDLAKAYHDMKMLKNRLEVLAVTDGLTGLFNHRHFHDELAQEMENAKREKEPLSLVLFDIDFFKKFNDQHGHKAGDAVIKGIADIVNRTIRESDIAARYGGEEYAIILPDTNGETAMELAEVLRGNVEKATIVFDEKALKVTISVGVALWDGELSDHRFIEQADKALYQSKDAGRNRVSPAF